MRNMIIALGLVAALAGAGTAIAGATPAQKCAAARRKCIGKDFAAVMTCYAKGATQGGVNQGCLDSAGKKLVACWNKADKGGCSAQSAAPTHIQDEDILPLAADLADNDTPTQ